MPSFFSELKRRNLLRAVAFYAAAAWWFVQLNVPDASGKSPAP